MHYNLENTSWEVFKVSSNINTDSNNLPVDINGNIDFNQNQDSWLIWFEYNNNKYDIYTRGLRFEFSSEKVSFTNITNEYNIDTYTSKPNKDTITVLNASFENKGKFFVTGYYTDINGIADTSKVILSLLDKNNDSRPNNPSAFVNIVNNNRISIDNQSLSGINNVRFEWQHNPYDNILVDPSFTNVMDVFALTQRYDTDFRNYLTDDTRYEKPSVPTSYELQLMFDGVNDKKAMSDTVVYRPVSYKPLFGSKASSNLRARFRVIKLESANITDSDVKVKVIEKINEYFDVNNWDFGETFYFTELAAYVHKELSGTISSFVIVPQGNNSVFGDLFEINPSSNEMFIPDVSIEDVDIIKNITEQNIRAGQQ